MQTKRFLTLIVLVPAALAVASPAGAAVYMEPSARMQPADGESGKSDSYRAGRRALESENWAEAVERFSEAAAEGGNDVDGALYWQAYALVKLNRPARARLALAELREGYPDSRWLDDARALELDTRPGDGRATDLDALEDEELKLFALSALAQVEWERARPLLEKFITGASPEMMERALFVLSQSDHPEARAMLVDVARSSEDPEVVGEAVHFLAFHDDDEARALVRQLYADSPNPEIRGHLLEAMMISDDQESLLSVARTEPNEELRGQAVEQLGILDATAELRQLYAEESSSEIRSHILEALMLADDKETLLFVTRNESDPELRSTAIEQLGLLDATPELRELYRVEPSPEIRGHIAEALMLADDAEFLIQIAESDQDPGVRRQAIEAIGLVDSQAAAVALPALYQKAGDVETKHQIIEAFMLQDNADALIEIIRSERNRELRMAAIETLSMMDSEAATAFMIGILEEGGS